MPLNNIFSRAIRRANAPATATPSWTNLFGGTAPGAQGVTPYSAPTQSIPPLAPIAPTGGSTSTSPYGAITQPTPTASTPPSTTSTYGSPIVPTSPTNYSMPAYNPPQTLSSTTNPYGTAITPTAPTNYSMPTYMPPQTLTPYGSPSSIVPNAPTNYSMPMPIPDLSVIPPGGSGPTAPIYEPWTGSLSNGPTTLDPIEPYRPGYIEGASSGQNLGTYGGAYTGPTVQAPTYGMGPSLISNIQQPNVITGLEPLPDMNVASLPGPNRWDVALNKTVDVAPGPALNVAPGPQPNVTVAPQGTIADSSLNPNFNRPTLSSVETTTTPLNPLTRQPWLTEGQQLAEDFNTKGLRTGEFSNVVSAQGTADTSASKRRALALQRANDVAQGAGYEPGTAQYQAVFDRALGEANSANLADSNDVRGLNRQMITDSLNRAGEFEAKQYEYATGDRAHTEGRDDIFYDRQHIDRLETKGDIERFLSTIDNPIARQFAENAWANAGGNATQFRADMAKIFKPDGSLTDEYQQMSATIPWRDIKNKYTQITTGALNPDTKKAWANQAEKDAYIESHTQEDYAAMIKSQYAPVTNETENASAIDELTAVFTQGAKSREEYAAALKGASDNQWKSMATNNPGQYDVALEWAADNGVVARTTVPTGDSLNTAGEVKEWLDSMGVTGYEYPYNPLFNSNESGININFPAGEGPLFISGGILYRLDYAKNWVWNQNGGEYDPRGVDRFRSTQVVGTEVLTGVSHTFQDEEHNIDG